MRKEAGTGESELSNVESWLIDAMAAGHHTGSTTCKKNFLANGMRLQCKREHLADVAPSLIVDIAVFLHQCFGSRIPESDPATNF